MWQRCWPPCCVSSPKKPPSCCGTCLKKCYFETYRFSEDLDFTLQDADHLDEDFLAGVFEEVGEWVFDACTAG